MFIPCKRLSKNACVFLVQFSVQTPAWPLSILLGIGTLAGSDFLLRLLLLLIFRAAKSCWRGELCCDKNRVIRSLAEPRLLCGSPVRLQEKTQRHPRPFHHWLVFVSLNDSHSTLEKLRIWWFFLPLCFHRFVGRWWEIWVRCGLAGLSGWLL